MIERCKIIGKDEADQLLVIIEMESRVGPASVRQIGNGKYVVILKAQSWHLWSLADYRNYLNEREAKQEAKRAAKVREKELVDNAEPAFCLV